MVKLIILAGVYGSGKTVALQCFEESGYYVTDNIPVEVTKQYFDNISKEPDKYKKVALSVELSFAKQVADLAKTYENFDVTFVGITCSIPILNERYRLTRKVHPRQTQGMSLEEALICDQKEIRLIRDDFDVYIDSSKLNKNDFRSYIYETCIGCEHKFTISFYSFGYKISVPQDIETVFDVRLLPNPYWDPKLKNLNGLDQEVKDYVLNNDLTKEFLKHVIEYLDYYLKELKANERNHASIGIACSGGQHRSVVIAEYLANYYSSKCKVVVHHKDLTK